MWTPSQYARNIRKTDHPTHGSANRGKGKAFAWLKAHVDYQGEACLPWPFGKDNRIGRGVLGYAGRNYWAHRLMCEMASGPPPTPKHQAAHNCGKGHYSCVNPRHLEWKTNSANQLDRRKNGNMLRNQHGPNSTLSDAQIVEMIELRATMTQVALAARYGVSLGCVQYWLKYRATRNMPKKYDYLHAIRAGLTPRDLATERGLHISGVAAQFTRLEQRGLASRQGDNWKITEEGLRLLAA